MACSDDQANMQEEEPVTKIIHECRCMVNEESGTETEDELDLSEAQEGEDQLLEPEEDEQQPLELEEEETSNGSGFNESNGNMSTYTVQVGDTLNSIAELFNVSIDQIQTWNNLSSVNSIYAGQVLNIFTTAEMAEPNDELNVTEATINYILNGQEGKPEAERLNWNELFLYELSIEDLYQQYITAGGERGNIENFAQYLTLNAPILDDWEERFKGAIYQSYNLEITNMIPLGDDLYQTYIDDGGIAVAHVIVSARTGYYY